ncbi:homoserine dehydrogenase [Thiomicrospira microaerophila]|uniref:homoserine dehydrogenase n=1 Tax=Thiomicrospira microaerophila TaxID=406020 RepID=UPI0005CB3390|nr:homoserine dehydrogenase [Thiomicrospira microaerophila]
MKQIKLGLLGLGTVGGGLVNILRTSEHDLGRKLGKQLHIEKIAVRDLSKPRNVDTGAIALTDDPFSVVNDPNVDLVVELMGGTTLARDLVEQAIKNGKHIVTANKALIALYGNELFSLAEKHQVQIYFEASVAGGIPIIKVLREGLAGNQIDWLAGIINGTGNYILTEMKKPNADFSKVLKDAQDLGYAEADPTYDVEGIDAAHKLTILASMAFGIELSFSRVYTEGISLITADDVRFANSFGYEIKHLGIAARTDEGYSLRVHPTLVPKTVLLADVNGVMNSVLVHGNHVGSTLYYGAGAGAGATASAVMADIIDLARGWDAPYEMHVPALGYHADQLEQNPNILNIDQIDTAFYLRFLVKDHPGVLARLSQTLADCDVSIEHLHQDPMPEGDLALVVMTTNVVRESGLNQAMAVLEGMDDLEGKITKIRVSDF